MELREIKKLYAGHGDIDSDINIIVRHVVGDNNLSPFMTISDKHARLIKKYINRHIKGEPVEKIIGYSIFCDCYIQYSRHTLTPRMETELLVEVAKQHIANKSASVLDLCCGSGAIGIALAKTTNARVACSDISKKALKMTALNAKLNNVKLEIIYSDLFHNIKERYDVIVCNPPYIPQIEYNELDAMVKKYDPKLALVADNDGFAVYENIAKSASEYLLDGGIIILEIGYNQGDRVKKIFEKTFKKVEVYKDYSDNDRIVVARK